MSEGAVKSLRMVKTPGWRSQLAQNAATRFPPWRRLVWHAARLPTVSSQVLRPNSSGLAAAERTCLNERWASGDSELPLSAREFVLACCGAVVFALAFCYPLLGHLSKSGFLHDWDFTGALHWVPYYSVSHFHQVPLWNPYKCGGMPMLANPQSRVVMPFFLLHLIFGPVVGVNLEIPIHIAIGWLGGYVLCRIQGLSSLAGVACASLFAGSSWFYLHMAEGHAVFMPALYLPWIAALMWLSMIQQRLLFAALAGLLVALTFCEGNVYAHGPLLVGIMALALAAVCRSSWPFHALFVFGAFSAGFSAIKLLPWYFLLEARPRFIGALEQHSLSHLYTSLFSIDQDLYRSSLGEFARFHEYGAYIGFIAAVLVIVGSLSSYRRAFPWLVSGGVFLVLAMGGFGRYAPWTLLHQMPIFSQYRIPSRFLIPFTLTAGVAAAFGVDFLRQHLRPCGVVLAGFLVIAMIIDLWRIGPPNLWYAFDGMEPVLAPSREFQQVAGEDGIREMLPLAKSNRGAIYCYDYFGNGYPTSVRGYNEGDAYRGEQYLFGQGTVSIGEWTPNALSYDIDTPTSNVLIVNQNYDPSWRVVEGHGRVFSQGGLIGVWIGAGKQRLKLAYRSYAFLIGAAITFLSSIGTLLLWRLEASN